MSGGPARRSGSPRPAGRPESRQAGSGRRSASAGRQDQAAGRQGPHGQPAPNGRLVRPNPAGAHYLTDRRVIAQLVEGSGAGEGDLVFDFGAGYGAITGPLSRTGARVIAVERDPKLARQLRRRFGDHPMVGIVEDDLRLIPLPRRPFRVVANPPFALTSALCRRLLGDREVRLAGADLILEWGAARRLADPAPGRREQVGWLTRYDLRLVRRIPAASFSPPPASDAAYLTIRPRPR